MAFLTEKEISLIGFKSYGKNLMISDKACFYQPDLISLGNNIRIDDFCILSGNIILHNYIHLAVFSYLLSSSDSLIEMEDFSGVSFKSTIMTNGDTFDGTVMTNPMVPDKFRKMTNTPVKIKKHALIGAHSFILPGADIEEGTAIGAMSLVTKPTKPWKIYFGNPARAIGDRDMRILELEQEFLKEISNE